MRSSSGCGMSSELAVVTNITSRQVVVELQIMVLEAAVLLGVEHLEQRRRRIAAEILAELVDLVEQEQRIAGPRLLQVRDDLARQRADIGAAVAADLGLVAHAAQRLASELAARRPGDRAAERGLADARRPDQAQDRALQLVGPRLDREIFDDPVLDLFEPVMVLVEHAAAPRRCRSSARISCPTAGRAARRDSCARPSPRRSSAPSPEASSARHWRGCALPWKARLADLGRPARRARRRPPRPRCRARAGSPSTAR